MIAIEEALERARDTKALEFGVGCMKKVPDMFKKLFPGKKAIVVADNNTFKAAGQTVDTYLRESGLDVETPFIFEDPELFAEWKYIEQLEAYLKERDVIAVAVGSGVINDLTKLVSHHLGRRYIIVGTAASMDGYTAYGASITYEGNKQTFDCPAPMGVALDPTIAAKAPEGMSASGYADLMAKIPAGADWIIADCVGSEAVDPFAFALVQDKLRDALSEPDAVAAGDVEATGKLADGLIMSGFAMQAISSSRPASGTDHQFSHFWDMEGLCYEGKHVSHGFKVAIGTLVSTACLGPELKEKIRKQIIPFDEVHDCLKRVRAPYEPEMIGVTKERLRSTFRCIPFMRNRFTGIDLIYRCGLMNEVEEHLFGKGGKWEVK